MRQDFHLSNDSGGLSILAADAVPAIVQDDRADDQQFVTGHQAILLSLVGDDSPIVRIVIDEPLTADEEAEWLAHIRSELVTPGGRVIVAGGFDPRTLGDWQAAGAPATVDGREVFAFAAPGQRWIVDVYTHADSMNGRQLVDDAGEAHGGAGAWFRTSRAGRPFPLWLADHLRWAAEGDPGHKALWSKPAANVRTGKLQIATEPVGFVGFLIHLTRPTGKARLSEPDEAGWFEFDAGLREREACPLGLPSEIARASLQELALEIAPASQAR